VVGNIGEQLAGECNMRKARSIQVATAFCLCTWGLSFSAEPPPPGTLPDEGRLDVESSWGQEGGGIISRKSSGDGKRVLHGIQVTVGPKNWLKEYAVYNNGILEQRTQFYPSGRTFRFQRREHNGDGYEVIYAPSADKIVAEGKAVVQQVHCKGTVKADKRWEGTFLVWEAIPKEFGLRLAVQEYRKGELIKSTPFSAKKLDLPENTTQHDGWLWDSPDWPTGTGSK
jgi:hypothetical protein